jgi:alpha-tubulin suppressor-like RCC1 family protein
MASVWTTAAVVLATLVAVTHPRPAGAATGALTVFAGSTGEGPGPAVAQDGYGLAVRDGRLYVADPSQNVVRAVDLATGYETVVAGTDVFTPGLDPYAGDTGDGGPALAARLFEPFSLAFDGAGNLFIGENGGSRVRRVDTAGIITTVAGGGASRAEGIPATDANLAFLLGVAIGPTGDLYISDYYNRLRRVDMTTGIITTVVGVGGSSAYAGDGGPAILAHLSSPGSLTFDPAGNLFFVDAGSIRKVDTAGIITTVVGGGPRPFGTEGPAREIAVAAHGLAVDGAGNIYLTDSRWVRKVTPSGYLSTIGGNGQGVVVEYGAEAAPRDGEAARDVPLQPWGLARDPAGNVYVSEAGRNRVRVIGTDGVIHAVAGNGTGRRGGDGGPAVNAQLSGPRGLRFDDDGNLFVADTDNSRLRRITPGGTITSVPDGRPEGMLDVFYRPSFVAFAPDGTTYVSSTYPTRVIQRIDSSGVTWPFAGTGDTDYGDPRDGGPATEAPLETGGLEVGADGVVYVADIDHGRVRRIGSDGIISTVAGGGSSLEDGIAATDAQIYPAAITLDGAGDIIVLDGFSSRVRRVSLADGTITTIAGTGTPGFSGDGGPAAEADVNLGINNWIRPSAATYDGAGNLFFWDSANYRVRRIASDGTISTVAGNGLFPVVGPAAPAADATTVAIYAMGLEADGTGNLYIADMLGNRVWKVDSVGEPTTTTSSTSTSSTSSTSTSSTTSTSTTSTTVPVTTRVRGWGFNGYGQVGDGSVASRSASVAVGPPAASAVAGGGFHSLAIVGGQVWSWGLGHVGQLGTGTTASRTSPELVPGLSGVTAVSAGVFHSLALKTDGTVWAWGWNAYGQLGTGATIDSAVPVKVPGLTGVVAVAAGGTHSLALRSDGTVWAWGYDNAGQLGTGGPAVAPSPAQVPGLSGITSIAAGGYHSLAVRSDGTVAAWGWNALGQLGDGTTVNRAAPVTVLGLTGVRAVSAGIGHTLAVRTNGSVWSWGFNHVGQLGRGGVTASSTPAVVPGLTGVAAVVAGGYHSLAVRGDGTVAAWGWNTFGQLGDGTTVDRHDPVAATGIGLVHSISAGVAHGLVVPR